MNCVAALSLALVIALPLFAEDRERKRQLVDEILVLIDGPNLAEAWLDQQYPVDRDVPELDLTNEDRKRLARVEQAEQEYRRRIMESVDRVALSEELYGEYFDENFSIAELEQLAEFYKTRAGQKSIPLLAMKLKPPHTSDVLRVARERVNEQLRKELASIVPWKTTMADMRTLAVALEARATDTNEYPDVAFSELETLLSPTYILAMPKIDGWGTPFLYVGNGEHYRLVSAGADRRFEQSSYHIDVPPDRRMTHNFDADIIFQDGDFLQVTSQPEEE